MYVTFSKKSLTQVIKIFYCVFSSRQLIDIILAFRSIICFEIVFAYALEEDWRCSVSSSVVENRLPLCGSWFMVQHHASTIPP